MWVAHFVARYMKSKFMWLIRRDKLTMCKFIVTELDLKSKEFYQLIIGIFASIDSKETLTGRQNTYL